MLLEFLQHSSYKNFAKFLYNYSFSEDERRDFEFIDQLIENKNFDFFVILNSSENSKPLGIISLWYFKEYIYIEHFAIDEKQRSKGYGKQVMRNFMDEIKLPIILEVENPIDEISQRRVRFYDSLGFRLLDYEYIQPSYSSSKKSIPMKLMVSNENLFLEKSIGEIVKEIHNIVYKVK